MGSLRRSSSHNSRTMTTWIPSQSSYTSPHPQSLTARRSSKFGVPAPSVTRGRRSSGLCSGLSPNLTRFQTTRRSGHLLESSSSITHIIALGWFARPKRPLTTPRRPRARFPSSMSSPRTKFGRCQEPCWSRLSSGTLKLRRDPSEWTHTISRPSGCSAVAR